MISNIFFFMIALVFLMCTFNENLTVVTLLLHVLSCVSNLSKLLTFMNLIHTSMAFVNSFWHKLAPHSRRGLDIYIYSTSESLTMICFELWPIHIPRGEGFSSSKQKSQLAAGVAMVVFTDRDHDQKLTSTRSKEALWSRIGPFIIAREHLLIFCETTDVFGFWIN